MTTGRINQVAFTCTHGYHANLGKFNQLNGRLKPGVPSINIADRKCKGAKSPTISEIRKRKPLRLVTLFQYSSSHALISGTRVLPRQESEVFLIRRGSPLCH